MKTKFRFDLKNINKLSLAIITLVLITFIISCSGEEEDSYLSTELSGLYSYKSAMMKDNCNTEDEGFVIDVSEEIAQPYFLLEGKRGDFETENDLLIYDCEDRKFDSCFKVDESENPIENIFATGYDTSWTLKNKVTAKYDYAKSECVFKRDKATGYDFEENSYYDIELEEFDDIGVEDLLEIKIDVYTYSDEDISSSDCRVSKIDYSKFKCVGKKKILTRRRLLNEKDRNFLIEKVKQSSETSKE